MLPRHVGPPRVCAFCGRGATKLWGVVEIGGERREVDTNSD